MKLTLRKALSFGLNNLPVLFNYTFLRIKTRFFFNKKDTEIYYNPGINCIIIGRIYLNTLKHIVIFQVGKVIELSNKILKTNK